MQESKEKCVTLTSSDDEETQDDMPRIIDAVSLQGCSAFAFDEPAEGNESILYPQCEIKEEDTTNEEKFNNTSGKRENGHYNLENKTVREKKRLKLTHLPYSKQNEPKPSTSRNNNGNFVDANKLALQENLFKTKELFDTFLRVCQDLANNPQMQRVVEKLTRAYGLARQEYLSSERFQSLLEAETEKVNTSNGQPWLNIKLVLDEMKYNKKSAPSKLKLGESEESQDGRRSDDEEPVIECPKKRRHLKKLEKTLRALNLKIKKLEEKEVDFDDDDSAYVKLDRYRAQFTKIYNKVCEIKGKLADADRPYLRKVSFAGTTYPHLNRCIERFYNKHREFPDFQDIKKLVEAANKQEHIEMQPDKIHQMASKAFKDFGEMLKRLRQYDDYDIIISYLDHQVDPAHNDKELQEELAKNALLFKKKEQEVIDKFAAQDAGINSDSNEDSDCKPKKKRRIIIKSQKKTTSPKACISSSESSDSSSDEGVNIPARVKTPELISSDESSEEESKKPTNKGKTLVGKKRVVKQGLKLKKPPQLHTTISSDEESDPKDTFTNYLGLHSKPKEGTSKQIKSEEDSENEIICIQNIKTSSPKKAEPSCDNDEIKLNLSDALESDSETNSSENNNRMKHQQTNRADYKTESKPTNSMKENSSTVMKKDPGGIKKKVKKTCNPTENIRKMNGNTQVKLDLQTKPASRGIGVSSDRISLSSDSDIESAERTSADESEFSAKKSVSDTSKAPSLDLSDNSSDSEHTKKDKKESDVDEPIVILSEDVVEVTKQDRNRPNSRQNSKDSDTDNDICVLSQSSSETRTVAPRRTRVNSVQRVKNQTRPVMSRKPAFATSTPKSNSLSIKRRGSSQFVNGVSKKRICEPSMPQVINGAVRKTVTRAPSCKPASSPDIIPLIELD